jgi:hypothetical protein
MWRANNHQKSHAFLAGAGLDRDYFASGCSPPGFASPRSFGETFD